MAWDDLATPFIETMIGADPEPAAYRPAGKAPRTITAVVDRNPPEPVPGAQRARSPVWHVWVLNDEDAGIAADALDTGGDKIDLAERVGGELSTRSITRIIEQDAGMIQLEVR